MWNETIVKKGNWLDGWVASCWRRRKGSRAERRGRRAALRMTANRRIWVVHLARRFPAARRSDAGIAQHGVARVRGAGRRLEHARMIAVGQHGSATAHHAIEATRDADGQALHAAGERAAVGRLDEQVHVIALHRKMDDAEAELAAAAAERRVN